MINSKNIFVWGKNPANTTIHTMHSIRKAKSNGSKIIVIDPIETETAKMADIYIKIKANGDLALALAMGKIIVEEKLYNKEYIKTYVNGFEEYKKYVLFLDINKLSSKCGVSLDDIRMLVKLYTEKYSTILLGFGMQKYKNGGNTIRAIDTLGAISGQIGFSGGGVNYANKVYPDIINSDPYNSSEYCDSRYYYTSEMSQFINQCINGKTRYNNRVFVNDLKDKSDEELNIPIKMAVITKSNLLNQLADLNSLKDSLSKIEFKVCFDMFMTDTANECDLFIPTTSTLESEDLLFSSMMNPYLIYNEKIVKPKYDLMDEYYFYKNLSKVLKVNEYPQVTKKEYLSRVIEPLKKYYSNISLELIKDNYITIHKPVAWDDKIFTTKSGKFEILNCNELKHNETYTSNSFRLLTNHGRDSLSSQHFMDELGIAKAYINECMARKLALENNEIVYLKSDNGQIKVEIIIDDCISDNIVMMYVGWWGKHGNPNYITNSDISDIGGQITYNETFVDIIKIK